MWASSNLILSNFSSYMARDPTLRSETFRYERGANQQFKQPAFTVNPAAFDEDEVSTKPVYTNFSSCNNK